MCYCLLSDVCMILFNLSSKPGVYINSRFTVSVHYRSISCVKCLLSSVYSGALIIVHSHIVAIRSRKTTYCRNHICHLFDNGSTIDREENTFCIPFV
jgi:hypothetical protein